MSRPRMTDEELIRRSHITNGRRMINWGGRGRITSHLIWNRHHPDDPVKRGEVVHHKNRDRLDDRIENYDKMTKAVHDRLHQPERVKAAVAANTGRACSEETKRKISRANRGRIPSAETRARMSAAHIGNTASEETKRKMSASQRQRRFAERGG